MDAVLRPPKRRKTRRDIPLTEGDAEAAEAVTNEDVEVSTRRGKAIKSVLVPLSQQADSADEETPTGHTKPTNCVWDHDVGGIDTGHDDPAYDAKTNMVCWVVVKVTLTFY